MRMISGIKLYLGLIVLISHAITDQLGCSNEEYKFQIKMNSILKMCNEERSFHCDRFSFFFCFFLLMEFFLLPQKARSILFDAINWSTIFFFFSIVLFSNSGKKQNKNNKEKIKWQMTTTLKTLLSRCRNSTRTLNSNVFCQTPMHAFTDSHELIWMIALCAFTFDALPLSE